jgi:hypothetical protein
MHRTDIKHVAKLAERVVACACLIPCLLEVPLDHHWRACLARSLVQQTIRSRTALAKRDEHAYGELLICPLV